MPFKSAAKKRDYMKEYMRRLRRSGKTTVDNYGLSAGEVLVGKEYARYSKCRHGLVYCEACAKESQ